MALPHASCVMHLGRLLLVCLALCACRGDRAQWMTRSTDGGASIVATTSTPVDSASLTAAQHVLHQFLQASRETTLNSTAADTLSACGDNGQSYFPTTVLAAYTLLPFESRGDTIVGRADVVSVAEQDIDRRMANRFIARQRVRHDVLEWDVIRVDDTHWAVCNGLRFGYRGVDSLTTWRPDGASYATVRALADSIVKVQP